jgi:hypothetical protein
MMTSPRSRLRRNRRDIPFEFFAAFTKENQRLHERNKAGICEKVQPALIPDETGVLRRAVIELPIYTG